MEILCCKTLIVECLTILNSCVLILEADCKLAEVVDNLRIDSVDLIEVRKSVLVEIDVACIE